MRLLHNKLIHLTVQIWWGLFISGPQLAAKNPTTAFYPLSSVHYKKSNSKKKGEFPYLSSAIALFFGYCLRKHYSKITHTEHSWLLKNYPKLKPLLTIKPPSKQVDKPSLFICLDNFPLGETKKFIKQPYNSNQSIDDVKKTFENQTGIPSNKQHIIYNGNEIKAGNKLLKDIFETSNSSSTTVYQLEMFIKKEACGCCNHHHPKKTQNNTHGCCNHGHHHHH